MLSRSNDTFTQYLGRTTAAAYQMALNYWHPQDDSPQYPDTMQVLLSLSILAFKPVGTQLRVKHHQIVLLEPDDLYWYERHLPPDSSYISYIKEPLLRAQREMNPSLDPCLNRIFRCALQGLERLKLTHGQSPITGDAIEQYKAPLVDALRGIGCPEVSQLCYPDGWTTRQVQILDLCLEEAETLSHDPDRCRAIAQAIQLIICGKRSDLPLDEERVAQVIGHPLQGTVSQGYFLTQPSLMDAPAPYRLPSTQAQAQPNTGSQWDDVPLDSSTISTVSRQDNAFNIYQIMAHSLYNQNARNAQPPEPES